MAFQMHAAIKDLRGKLRVLFSLVCGVETDSLASWARQASSRWAPPIVLFLAPVLYIHTLGFDFVSDDFLLILQNQYFKAARYVPLYFTSDFVRLTSGGQPVGYYRPLFGLSFLVDFLLWGNNPAGYHLTNLLAYTLVVGLILGLSRALFADGRVAVAAALLFALHPAHVEAVAWVSARPDILAALGMVSAVWCYRRFRQARGGRRWLALAGSLLGFALGLLSKEMALSLPAILAWYELVFSGDPARPAPPTLGRRFLPLLPHLALGLGFLVAWSSVRSKRLIFLAPHLIPQRLPGAFEALARYVILAVWPFGMQPAYVHPRPQSLLSPWPVVGLALAVLSALLLVRWRRRQPEAAFALGWFLISLAPVADLIPFPQRTANIVLVNMADRYLFIPSLGICWLLALAGVRLWDRAVARSRRAAVAFGATAIGLLLAWTWSTLGYATVWRENLTLFSREVRDAPQSAFGYNNLGLALVRAGRIEEAVRALETAVRLDPGDVRAQLSLARTYVESGRTIEGFRILDRLRPRANHDKMYFLVRARAHMAVNEWDAAYRTLSQGLQQFPDLAEAHQVLGFVQEQRGRVQEARDAYRRAVRFRPDLLWSHLGLARIQLQFGDLGEAVSEAQAAVRLDSSSVAAWRILALALEQRGDVAGSRQAWERVLELDEAPEGIAEARRHLFAPGTPDER